MANRKEGGKPRRFRSVRRPQSPDVPDELLDEREIELRRALGYEVRSHKSGRVTASKRTHKHVMELWRRLNEWRSTAVEAAYEGREARLERAQSDEQVGMAPEGHDAHEWLSSLEKLTLGKSAPPRAPLTVREAELLTAFLLGIREAVSHLESAEFEQLESRKRGGLRTRKREAWLKKLLKSLWHPDLQWPSTWEELADWLKGADKADLSAAGLASVTVEGAGKKARVVAEFVDGTRAGASRESAMRAKNRLRRELEA